MDQERDGDEMGQKSQRDYRTPLRHRIAAWLSSHIPALQEREVAAYRAGQTVGMMCSRPHPQPGVILQTAVAYTRFQLAHLMPWEMSEMEPRVKLELIEKMIPMLMEFAEYWKVEDLDNMIQFRARLIVHRTEDGGKTFIQEAGKEARRAVLLPGEGSDTAQGSTGPSVLFGGREGSGVLPKTQVGDKED